MASTSNSARLSDWIERGFIPADRIEQALQLTGVRPDAPRWRAFLDSVLLWLGVLSLACAVSFLVAYNWQELGRMGRFALVQALLVLTLLAWARWSGHRSAHQALLVASALVVGALLALYGQTYQTGADTWQLFASWAALITPWVLLGRSAALWLLWLALLNVAVILYFQVFPGLLWIIFSPWEQMAWALFGLNGLAWVAAEWTLPRLDWQHSRWPLRLVAVAAGTALTLLVLYTLFESAGYRWLAWLVYGLWLLLVYRLYRHRIPDLFLLAGAGLSLVVCLNSLLAKLLIDSNNSGFGFFVLSNSSIVSAALLAIWLRQVHRQFQGTSAAAVNGEPP